jgi:predicted metal-dependent phosphoesterase TrpH
LSVDLHLHSRYSDGTAEPAELVEMAIAVGLTAIALTDHDNFDGITDARTAAAGRIDLVPGVELSIEWGVGGLHLLGWWVEPGSPLDLGLVDIRTGREERNIEMIAALNALGYPVTYDRVLQISEKGVAGRPHIAQALVEVGAVATEAEAFDRLLTSGAPAYRDRKRMTMELAVSLIRESGGVAAVAHPHTVASSADGFSAAFARFADLGVTGVECWYPEYPPEQREAMAKMATRYGLVPTGGSDYHGTHKPDLAVGTGRGDLAVPDRVLEQLAARRP